MPHFPEIDSECGLGEINKNLGLLFCGFSICCQLDRLDYE